MEAISTSVPSINNLPKLNPKSHYYYHHHHHLKPSILLPHPQISSSTTVSGKPPNSISTKPTPPSHHTHIPPRHLQSTSPTQTHRNDAATGYAAALIDAALSSNSLDAVHKDVKRLLTWLNCNEMLKGMMADVLVEEGVKGRLIKEVSEKGKLHRRVVVMVKMLVAKNKSGMVGQVMEEFQGIYRQLNRGLRVVV